MTTYNFAGTNVELTELEAKVLDACWQAALASTGGDFALLDEVSVKGLGRKALGGVVTSLGTKRVISVDETHVNAGYQPCNNGRGYRFSKGTRIVQVTFDEEYKAARRGERS